VLWISQVPDAELHISAVTISEIQAGIEVTREQDQAKALELERWLALGPHVGGESKHCTNPCHQPLVMVCSV
jgi:predicted nucleic acid-binding protein